MRRILVIAKRDYLQTVLNKAFLVGLIFVPFVFGGGMWFANKVSKRQQKPQRIAVLDHTGYSARTVILACEESDRRARLDPETGIQAAPQYEFETVQPQGDRLAQLLTLSDRIRKRELLLALEIPASGEESVRFYSNAASPPLEVWLRAAVNDGLRRVRLERLPLDEAKAADLLKAVPLLSMDLVARDPENGVILPASPRSIMRSYLAPMFLVVLLMMVVLSGSAPLLGAVAEDKMQRVFEMMLTSATPFEIMAGKVLAGLGASLTSSVFYIVGGLLGLSGAAMFGAAPLHLLPWFFLYLIANVTMLAATAVALGSACATPHDAQSLAFILFLPIFVPMVLLSPVMQQPAGTLAVAMSLVPPFTPVLMLIRQSLPGEVPWWQLALGIAGICAWATFLVWASSRIFRIGILAQGKTPKLSELLRWIARG